jgi:hypothetical protein
VAGMLLVAGGQLDPNIGALLRRMLERGTAFCDLLVGPDSRPRLTIDLASGRLVLDGEATAPTGCFIRHDVFLHQKTGRPADHAAALNWFYAIRGWSLSRPTLKLLNRHSYLSENNKLENLLLAARVGLSVPETVVTNDFGDGRQDADGWIQKPVAGGDYTTTLGDFLTKHDPEVLGYPRFVQRRMARPELRIYRVGPRLFGFHLHSSEIDYRTTHEVAIEPAEVPAETGRSLLALCDLLGLDFAAADFMRDATGRLRFLEVNTQPMFAAFDAVVQGRLCDAIIDVLEQGDAG